MWRRTVGYVLGGQLLYRYPVPLSADRLLRPNPIFTGKACDAAMAGYALRGGKNKCPVMPLSQYPATGTVLDLNLSDFDLT